MFIEKMMTKNDILYIMYNVIDSCVHKEQLSVAMNYCRLLYKKMFINGIKSDSHAYEELCFFESFLIHLHDKKLQNLS